MQAKVTKISYTNEITLISLSLPDGRAVAQVLGAFSEAGVNVDMISQTAPQGGAVRMSFSLSDRDLAEALTVLGKLRSGDKGLSPEILPGNCKIACYDADMVRTPGVAAKVFALLSEANVPIPAKNKTPILPYIAPNALRPCRAIFGSAAAHGQIFAENRALPLKFLLICIESSG